MYPYPDVTAPTAASPGTLPRSAARPEPWRRGYMANAKLAGWPLRVASGLIDYVPLALIWNFFAMVHAAGLGAVVSIALGLANSVYMQGTTGQSLGKRIVGTRLVSAVETGPWEFAFVYPGAARCLGRQVAHILDTIPFYTGYLRPLWQREHKTWADSTAKTVVLDRSATAFAIRARRPGEPTTRCL